jgi:hypothetical protein
MGPIASLELLEERNCLVPAGDWWAVMDRMKGNQSVGHIERLASYAGATVRKVAASTLVCTFVLVTVQPAMLR